MSYSSHKICMNSEDKCRMIDEMQNEEYDWNMISVKISIYGNGELLEML